MTGTQDLSLLNRDIQRVILFEDHAAKATCQPENTIDVPAFTGDDSDTYLIKILPFLEGPWLRTHTRPGIHHRGTFADCSDYADLGPKDATFSACRVGQVGRARRAGILSRDGHPPRV